MSDEQWHGIAVQTCLKYARRMAWAMWARHGRWCDSSDYEGEALAALGLAVVRYQALPGGGTEAFASFFRQRIRYALTDYYRRGCGSDKVDAAHPRGRGGCTAWRRYEWSWGDGLSEDHDDATARTGRRERWLLRHLRTDRWEQRLEADILVAQLLETLPPAESRAVVALRIEGLTTDEYGARWAVKPQTGVVVVSQALARLRAQQEEVQ